MNRRIASVYIENFGAIAKLEFRFANCVLITGHNGAGKSAVIQAIMWPFVGGHDPQVIRGYSGPAGKPGDVGLGGAPEAKKALVRLTLEDGATITRECTRKTAGWKIVAENGIPVEDNRAWLDRLTSGFAFDPLAFCDAKPEERVAWFARVCRVEFSATDVNEAAGVVLVGPAAVLDLEQLAAVRRSRYERRRDVNVAAREAEGAWQSLQGTLPADDGTDWVAETGRLEGEVRTIEQRINTAKLKAGAAALEETDALKAKVNAEIAELDRQITDKRLALADECAAIERRHDLLAEEAIATDRNTLASVKIELGAARAKQSDATRHAEVRRQVDHWQKKMVSANSEADAITKQLDALDNLRTAKLSESPVPGVEVGDLVNKKNQVTGKDLVVAGVPWDRVNESERILTAMRIGSQAAGELTLLVCDEGGVFDSDRRKWLAERCEVAGIQLIMAVAEPGPLAVEALS